MTKWVYFTFGLVFFSGSQGFAADKPVSPLRNQSVVMLNKWYEVVNGGQKTGYFNEKIIHQKKDDLLIYTSLTHQMQEGLPVEEIVESTSRFKDLVPLKYIYTQNKPGTKKVIQGEVKAGTLYIPNLDKTYVLPIGTYFSGLFPLVIKRQMPLKENIPYNLNLFYEDIHEYKTSIVRLVKKLPQNHWGLLATVNDLQFEMIIDDTGAIVETLHGPLSIREIPYSKARENWEHSSKFKAPVQ